MTDFTQPTPEDSLPPVQRDLHTKQIIVLDLEADNFLADATTIHCMAIAYLEPNGEVSGRCSYTRTQAQVDEWRDYRDTQGPLSHDPTGLLTLGLKDLGEAILDGALVAGHNAIKYDMALIKKIVQQNVDFVYCKPTWDKITDKMIAQQTFDTFLMSKVIFSDLRNIDWAKSRRGNYQLPANMYGSHGLKAWGYRLRCAKDDYSGGFDQWSPSMHKYMIQDVEPTVKLLNLLRREIKTLCVRQKHNLDFIYVENRFHQLMEQKQEWGWHFDMDLAVETEAKLRMRAWELEKELLEIFRPITVRDKEPTVPRRNRRVWYVMTEGVAQRVAKSAAMEYMEQGHQVWYTDYEADSEYWGISKRTFNPGSREEMASRLVKEYGWEPTEFGKDGKPKLDDSMLGSLSFPGVEKVQEYLMVSKRLGQLSDGKQAWLKKVGKDGRMHARIDPLGTITSRCSHSNPNDAQCPSKKAPWGKEFRQMWVADKGWDAVGADASALELVCLAGYLAPFDGGEYVRSLEDGTDRHSLHATMLGLDPKKEYDDGMGNSPTGREIAKTWFYAFIYGAFDKLLGSLVGGGAKEGKVLRSNFMKNFPALKKLVLGVQAKARTVKYVIGLDGRPITCRSPHSALNALLQSAGAMIMKRAAIIFDDLLTEAGILPGEHYKIVGNIHDEWQLTCDPQYTEEVKKLAVEAITAGAAFYDFPCPLKAEAAHGRSWYDTH